VEELARQVSADYEGAGELLLVGVLRGCFIFLADLARLLTIPRRIDFMALAAYGQDAAPSGAVRLIMDLRTNISGKHVLIVEDISGSTFPTNGSWDTGWTMRIGIARFLISAW
jgi:hypoxanthine phosphoribosyltransferase